MMRGPPPLLRTVMLHTLVSLKRLVVPRIANVSARVPVSGPPIMTATDRGAQTRTRGQGTVMTATSAMNLVVTSVGTYAS